MLLILHTYIDICVDHYPEKIIATRIYAEMHFMRKAAMCYINDLENNHQVFSNEKFNIFNLNPYLERKNKNSSCYRLILSKKHYWIGRELKLTPFGNLNYVFGDYNAITQKVRYYLEDHNYIRRPENEMLFGSTNVYQVPLSNDHYYLYKSNDSVIWLFIK
jgi:hypothetical protein